MTFNLLISVEAMNTIIKATWANTPLLWYYVDGLWHCARQKRSRTLKNVTGHGNTKDEAFAEWRKLSGVGP